MEEVKVIGLARSYDCIRQMLSIQYVFDCCATRII